MKEGIITIIQGGQYGSEGKGQVAAEIASRHQVTMAVRTGSINAGHTVHYAGKPYTMQIIPTSWVIPGVKLVLGAGCYIQPEVLAHEVELIKEVSGEDVRNRLVIDHRCAWFGDIEYKRSKAADRHHAMGATGKGCSEAIISKMNDRGAAEPRSRLFKFSPWGNLYNFDDTVSLINHEYDIGGNVLLEGTQGTLLDFNTGPYPFVTSRMTTPAAWMAEAGLSPRLRTDIVLVLRTFPIRVAGNSGPMPDEISWPILAREINNKLAVAGKDPLVDEDAIRSFEETLLEVVEKQFPAVDDHFRGVRDLRCFDFHKFTPEERHEFRVCISEANAEALKKLPQDVLDKLKFFEKTTVTKKLRRISRWNYASVQTALDICRPTKLVLSFVNYLAPDVWGAKTEDELITSEHYRHGMAAIHTRLRAPFHYVTTGPLPEHMVALH